MSGYVGDAYVGGYGPSIDQKSRTIHVLFGLISRIETCEQT